MERKSNTRVLVLLLFIAVVIGLRMLAPLSPDFKLFANFSGLGAVAIFSGSYFKNKFSGYVLPILVLLLSDLGLALMMGESYVFYPGWYYTYIAFALMVLAAQILVKKVNVANVFVATLVGVLIHWIVSDFGMWLGFDTYPKTLAGFWECLVAAIPFELKFLYGTLVYSAIMFMGFEVLKSKFPSLKQHSAIA
ncbi:DUF6580 family putative transport protein [Pedobacter chitinilyticus]|uniref:ECF transporter S component n=1 Tax=Pedobacter chitinilyticus TaxID=2233776 RepID=A0A443Z191_9SPHI|nr:DUF6580 family putative transport protein [Pedobacter chitinilyticus]RWU10239.1 hypothetical protein DPV69_02525 [Pedobacter chitinilyticus]